MKKFKGCYAILTLFLPIATVLGLFTMGWFISHYNYPYAWWYVAINSIIGWVSFAGLCYILIPVGVNLVLGPSIIAYLACKQSRAFILILNLIAVGWFWRIKDTSFDALGWSAWLPWVLILLLYGWTSWGRTTEGATPKLTLALLLIAHAGAIGFVHYGLYKSPEQRVAEEMLKHRTIKWEHDGKIEYFCTYDPETPAGYGYTDSGLYYAESASTGLFDHDGFYRTEPVSTGAFDQNGNFKGHERYTIWFYSNRLAIVDIGSSGRPINISYEQLFKSKDIELIDSHTKPDLRSAALGPFAFPGYSLPGQYGWQYDADFAPDRAFRYAWDDYFNGVHYSGYVDSENKLYVNTYGDHGENLDSFLFAGWLDGNGANGTFTHSHDWSQDSSWPHHIRSFSQTYLFGKAVEMPKGWQDVGMIPRDLGMIPEDPAKH
jgi:hypothetical protein